MPANLRRFVAALAVFATLASPAYASDKAVPEQSKPANVRVPKIQIALLLDNSGSMSGLLNQARTQLWAMVNELAQAKQKGVRPRIEIAIYEYGAQPKQLTAFTSDLDKVSEILFGIGISGGDEYCGQVIQESVQKLEWSGNPDDLKLIYIAGNEPFTQGPVAFRTAIADAKKKGIMVNPIHCGGDDASWREGAVVAGAKFMMINHNAQVAAVTAPQDAELARLGGELNKTYLGYGSMGASNMARQQKMDQAAGASAPAAMAERAKAKSSVAYDNSDWDLVDAKKGGKSLGDMKEEELPAELQGKDKAERERIVEQKAKERGEIQAKIAKLSAEREKFLAEERKKSGSKDATLDQALVESVRTEGAKKAFSF